MKKRKMGVTGNEVKPRWELDYDLLENEGLFGEYLEMGKAKKRFGCWTIFKCGQESSMKIYYPWIWLVYLWNTVCMVLDPNNCGFNK